MKNFRYLFCNIIFLFPISSQAIENQIATVAGVGTMSCGEYLFVQSTDRNRTEVLTWLQGFMTGENILRIQLKKNLINIPNHDELYDSAIAYCRQYPNETIFMTAAKLVNQYESSGQMHDPTLTSPRNKK